MFGKIKRVAVCLSGQPRTWRTAKDNILSYFDLKDKDIEVDFFIHTWDTNQYRKKNDINWVDRKNEKVSYTEKDEMAKAFNAISIEMEEYSDDSHITLWASLLYSFMKSVWLKRKYEIENDFRYDLVIKARTDINYPLEGICNLNFNVNRFHIHPIQPLTAYSTIPVIPRFPSEFNYPCFDDVLFYSNSSTMDIISNCYRWYSGIIRENGHLQTQGKYIQDSTYWYGPGTILYKYLIENGIHPEGYRFIQYYVVRKEVEDYNLNSIVDWKDISEFNKEWYNSVLNKKDTPSILDKYK